MSSQDKAVAQQPNLVADYSSSEDSDDDQTGAGGQNGVSGQNGVVSNNRQTTYWSSPNTQEATDEQCGATGALDGKFRPFFYRDREETYFVETSPVSSASLGLGACSTPHDSDPDAEDLDPAEFGQQMPAVVPNKTEQLDMDPDLSDDVDEEGKEKTIEFHISDEEDGYSYTTIESGNEYHDIVATYQAKLGQGSTYAKSVNGSGADWSNDSCSSVSKSSSLVPPPMPTTGQVNPEAQARVDKLMAEKATGKNLNECIQSNKNFRNPSIYEKLITHMGINEHGTNFPREEWPANSYYDHLATVQAEEMRKREKQKQDKPKVEFVTAVRRSTSRFAGYGNLPPPRLIFPCGPLVRMPATRSTGISDNWPINPRIHGLPEWPRLPVPGATSSDFFKHAQQIDPNVLPATPEQVASGSSVLLEAVVKKLRAIECASGLASASTRPPKLSPPASPDHPPKLSPPASPDHPPKLSPPASPDPDPPKTSRRKKRKHKSKSKSKKSKSHKSGK